MEKIFAHYEAVIGDTVQIETDGGEKIPFKVMATAKLPDKLYGGYYIFVPQDLLNVIKAGTSNFNSKLLCCIDLENISQAEAVLQAVNMEIYTNIVQTSLMIKTGNISEKEFYDYLNIEYCGATPPASYISPKDVVLYSINNSYGRSAVEELMDNKGK